MFLVYKKKKKSNLFIWCPSISSTRFLALHSFSCISCKMNLSVFKDSMKYPFFKKKFALASQRRYYKVILNVKSNKLIFAYTVEDKVGE